MKTKSKPMKWSADDRQAFADRNILRAQTIPNKKRLANKNACRKKFAQDF